MGEVKRDPLEIAEWLEKKAPKHQAWSHNYTEAAACIREMVERDLPSISKDGPNEIDDHRYWLARQLLDSKLTKKEAYEIVAYHPAIYDCRE